LLQPCDGWGHIPEKKIKQMNKQVHYLLPTYKATIQFSFLVLFKHDDNQHVSCNIVPPFSL